VKEERPRQISDIRTLDGNVEIGASKEALKFRDNSESFIHQYERLHTHLCRNNEKIFAKSQDLATLHLSNSALLKQLSNLFSNHLQLESASRLYTELA
jgi:hypothetical protein